MDPEALTLSSFGPSGDERVRTVPIPERFRGQQSVSLAGWELTVYEDGTLHIERNSAVTAEIALRPTLHALDGQTYGITVKPVVG